MSNLRWFRFLLVVGVLLGGIPLGMTQAQDDAPQPITMKAECQAAVNGLNDLHAAAGYTPDHLQLENAVIQPDDFDVMRYFEVLGYLAMEDGTILDYVYLFEYMGGHPILYPFPADEPPLTTIEEYSAYFWHDDDDEADPSVLDYRSHIMIDDSPTGYLQMAVLDWLAGQFYLYWHSNYNDWRVICDADMLKAAFASTIDEVPVDVQADALVADLIPTVTLYDDYAEVRLVTFTEWGGLYEWHISISREFPRTTFEWESNNLVDFYSGVAF